MRTPPPLLLPLRTTRGGGSHGYRLIGSLKNRFFGIRKKYSRICLVSVGSGTPCGCKKLYFSQSYGKVILWSQSAILAILGSRMLNKRQGLYGFRDGISRCAKKHVFLREYTVFGGGGIASRKDSKRNAFPSLLGAFSQWAT